MLCVFAALILAFLAFFFFAPHAENIPEMTTCAVWTRCPAVLLSSWYELVPCKTMSSSQKTNAITRLILLVGLACILYRLRVGVAATPILYAVATAILVLVISVCIMHRKSCNEDKDEPNNNDNDPKEVPLPPEVDPIYATNERAYQHATMDEVPVVNPTDSDAAWVIGDVGRREEFD